MPTKQLSIPRLNSGGLITNYYCTSSCRHCLYRCGPKWPKDYIASETARQHLKTILKFGCTSIHIGGGEPLLKPHKVISVLALANEIGVHVDYVETNSSWYKDNESACLILENLSSKGLSTLLVSISPFHNEYIPFYKVKGLIKACQQTGINVLPWIADFVADMEALDGQKTHDLEEFQKIFGEDYLEKLPSRYWIAPGGRALDTFNKFSIKKSIPEIAAQNNTGCHELANTSHFHFDLYGNYIPGLCSGLSIQIEDLDGPLDPDEYPIISRLNAYGVEALISYAAEKFGFKPSKALYGSKCELCFETRRFLVVDKNIDSKELQPHYHYIN